MTRPKADEALLWPPQMRMAIYRPRNKLKITSRNRYFDLEINIRWHGESFTFYFGMLTKSPLWKNWSQANLRKIESAVQHDLEYGGNRIKMIRLSKRGAACSNEFIWKIVVRGPCY